MAVDCDHNCENCSVDCAEREIVKLSPKEGSNIRKIIGVISGKGGVGKSMVSSLLAVSLARNGKKVGIMDADITGPSIPNIFGLGNEKMMGDGVGIFPIETPTYGIKTISVNMMLESSETPVLWRGPIVSNIVTQFFTEVYWGDLDYLIIDMPPGTSDVALTILQMIPVDAMVMVTTPSKLVSTIVAKAINMANSVDIPITGIVENMSYVVCDNCEHIIKLYDESDADDLAARYNLEVLARLPLDKSLSSMADEGNIELYQEKALDKLVERL